MRRTIFYTTLFILALSGAVLTQDDASEPDEQPLEGPARLDLNTRPGDQAQRTTFNTPSLGATVTVDVAVTEGGKDRTGYDLLLEYDDARLQLISAEPVDLFSEAAPLFSSPAPGRIEVAGLMLGAKTARGSGSVAHLNFTVLDSLAEGTRISLLHAHLGTALMIDSLQVGVNTGIVTIGAAAPPLAVTPDFDGDGSVGFADFLIFASGFGTVSGSQSYNPALDLDESGDVGFGDFLIFAQAFGS